MTGRWTKSWRAIGASSALLLAACAKHAAVTRAPVLQPTVVEREVANAVDAGDGDFQLKQLRARLERDPGDLSARLEIARHYRETGFPEISLEHLRLACERAPESVEAHIELAKMLRQTSQVHQAAATLEEFAAHHETVEVWAWIGLLRDESGAWAGGEQAHRHAITLQADRDDLHNNLGYCLLREGKKEEAAQEFRTALRLNPGSVIARNNLGLALAGHPDEAVLNWQSVADAATAHNNMAVALIEAGKYAEARKEIEIALSYNRQNPAALSNLRLVSQLDGKPAVVAPRSEAPARVSRLAAAWRRFWGRSTADSSREKSDSGMAVAAR